MTDLSKRLSITLIPQAVEALDWQVKNTVARTASEAACRSLSVNTFLQKALAEGKTLLLMNPDGTTEQVHIV